MMQEPKNSLTSIKNNDVRTKKTPTDYLNKNISNEKSYKSIGSLKSSYEAAKAESKEQQNNLTKNEELVKSEKLIVKSEEQENSLTNNIKKITTNKKQETTNEKQTKQQTKNKKQETTYSYGLQWNLPLQNGLEYNDINADNKPLILLIPQVWVSKQFGKKHSLMLGFNLYSQYFVSNKAVANISFYSAAAYSSSQIDNKPDNLHYTEASLFNKLISTEVSLTYQYQLSQKIKVGAGIGNNWVQGALLKNRVVKNNTYITRDSLYGIDERDTDWSYIKQTFLLGKIEIQYQIKKLDIGVSFSKPIGNMFNNIEESRTPINTNLFVRWKLN